MKYLTSIWTTLLLVAMVIGVRIQDPQLVEEFRLSVFDQYIKSLPVEHSNDIVLVNIGEKSLEKYGQYPWPRQNYAQMISDLRNANAGMIGFTIMFPEPDRFGGDEVFASWVKDNGIILSQDADANGRSKKAPYVGYATFGYSGDVLNLTYRYGGLITNIDSLESSAWGAGLLNAAPEIDNVTRRIPLMSQINGDLYPSFALETIRAMNDKKSYTIKLNETGIEQIVLRPFQIPTDSNGSIWLKWNSHYQEIEYDGSPIPDLKGKTVVIGVTAKGIVPQTPTADGLKYPHQLQANAIQTIISDNPISRPQWTLPMELALALAGALLIVLCVYYGPVWLGLVSFALTSAGVVVVSWYFWTSTSILLDLTGSLILYILSFTSASFNNFYIQFKLRQQIKKQFGTYLSPDMVNALQKNPGLLKLGGDRKEMTFLFMDIVGFTPISEHYKNNDDPEGLVELVNEFLDAMTKIILSNGGTIDKYMGDCIMAFWNAPLPCPNHAEMAVKSAIEIEEKTNELKELYKERGLPDINVGTGVNTGDCIVGNMGSETRFDYSVIGDAVNLAARLEATAARHDYIEYKTIISSFTQQLLPEGYVSHNIGTIKVKGKEEEITIYSPKFKK